MTIWRASVAVLTFTGLCLVGARLLLRWAKAGDDQAHTFGTALWHHAYCNWYDRDRAGHRVRAIAWGWVADRLVRFA